MSLRVIDVASYQSALNMNNIDFDGAVMKATEGTTYVNPYCDTHFQQAKAKGKKLGVYHFAGHGDANAEAQYFVDNIRGYIGQGIIALDWEGSFVADVNWALTWLNRVHDLTGVKPLIYMSEYVENHYDWSPVIAGDYGLWIAKYADYEIDNNYDMSGAGTEPVVKHWPFYVMWQWTSAGRVSGYAGNLDCDAFYGTTSTWDAYAGSTFITTDQLNALYNELLGRPADQDGINHYVGHYSVDFTRNDILNSGERQQYLANVQAQAAAEAAKQAQAQADAAAAAQKAADDAKAAADKAKADEEAAQQPTKGETPTKPSEPATPVKQDSPFTKFIKMLIEQFKKFLKS